MKFPDYYATLGVEKTATAEALKKAFRRLARKYHPDISKESDAAERMTALNEANNVLSDPEKRKAYDQVGHQAWAQGARSADDVRPPPGWNQGYQHASGPSGAGAAGGPGFGQDHSEFFEELFGRAAQQRSNHRSSQSGQSSPAWNGEDQHVEITLDLAQAYQGSERTLQLASYRIDEQGQAVPETRTLSVKIPQGVAQGQLIRLSGQGSPGFGGGKAGDLFMKVNISQTDGVRISSRDVTMPVFVSPWEAALGGEIEVNTPAGPLTVNIPAGSVAGRKLRLRGKGIPANQASGTAGDLYFELNIAVPSAVTEQQKQAWQALSQAYPGFEPRVRKS
jgi:curved DNA-binding protein